jgi:heat shock protein HslJ
MKIGGNVQRGNGVLRRCAARLVLGAACVGALVGVVKAEAEFPYGQDLLLDVRPMKGSKRVPIIEIDDNGAAVIDLWCNSVEAQADINGATITITTGQRTERECPPDRAKADDDVIDALQQVTGWRRSGDRVVLIGPRTLSFRLPTN